MSRDAPPLRRNLPVIEDPVMRSIFDTLERLAAVSLPILLLGESGSGKEVLCEWVHGNSDRADKLVKVNCAGLTESVVESELFGHERGAFTGAVQSHPGLFEVADGGTLFLDEIAELPLRTQAKLLRVLETGEFARVGSTRLRKANVRLIAATHRDLPRLVEKGEFRQDLYFRLNGATIEIPPLRERRCEIIPLATVFLQQCARLWKRPELTLATDAVAALMSHSWPGNVRELRHVIERAVAMCRGPILHAEALAIDRPLRTVASAVDGESRVAETLPSTMDKSGNPSTMRSELREFERAQILAALKLTNGNQTQAAKLLGVSRRTLYNKLVTYGVGRSRRFFSS